MGYQGFFKILMITLISRKNLGVYKIMRNTVLSVTKLIQYLSCILICFQIFYSFVIMASTLISIPKFFEFTHIEIENGTTKYWTSELNENAVYVWSNHESSNLIFTNFLHQCYVIFVLIFSTEKKKSFQTSKKAYSFSTENYWWKN